MPNTEQTVEDSGEDEDEGEQIAQKLEVAIQHLNFTGYSLWGGGGDLTAVGGVDSEDFLSDSGEQAAFVMQI